MLDGLVTGVRKVALPALGLACWISSLLLYSETITPFQDIGASAFVGLFAERALALGVLVAAVAAACAFTGRHMPSFLLGMSSGTAYVFAAIQFALLSSWGVPEGAKYLVWFLAACTAFGATGTALMWGRVYKRLEVRESLGAVALAGFMAALLGIAYVVVPGNERAILLVLFALVAAGLPLGLGTAAPEPDAGLANRPFAERLRSMTSVTAPAFMGLLSFAYVMGTMRALIVETYPVHIGTLVACSAVLAVFASLRRWGPLARTAYHNLIPVLAVCLLAVTNVSLSLWGGSTADMVGTYLLYTLAALLTLATLAAVAHAGEFSSDLVVAVAVALFCLASFAGLVVGGVVTPAQMRASTSVITTIYAFAVVLARGLQAVRGERAEASFARDAGAAGPERPEPRGAQGLAAEKPRDPEADLERRCALLAEEHHLTAREAEIMRYVARGHGSAYIGEALYISQNTVRTHAHNLYRKLGVRSREEVLAMVRSGDRPPTLTERPS